jgi:hypothetical protein
VMLMPGYKIVILFAMPSAYASKMAEWISGYQDSRGGSSRPLVL